MTLISSTTVISHLTAIRIEADSQAVWGRGGLKIEGCLNNGGGYLARVLRELG